ncbi:hypothetical protein FB570_101210 [Streptomyces sp. T12]|nr:hypothetical protein FB570_101210 [Streptomyces sp. T12]
MSWAGPSASLASTVSDLNRFHALLPAGEIVGPSSPAEMRATVPVVSQDGRTIDYGLGLHPLETPGLGQETYRGHGGRQRCVAVNLQRCNAPGAAGRPRPHAVDAAPDAVHRLAMYG